MRKLLSYFLSLLMALLIAACATAPQRGDLEELGEGDPAPGTMVMLVDNLPDLVFDGVTRKDAKLTMVASTTPTYTSITAVTSLTAPDVNRYSDRTGVEKNYAQFTAYLYAYNLPADNDFHLILGDTATFKKGTTNLINVEVSGRPDTKDTVFKAVRTAFLAKVGNPTTLPRSVYQCLATPIAITVSGGPFWDTSHPSGGSGTSSCNSVEMKTSNGWELHPVTAIN